MILYSLQFCKGLFTSKLHLHPHSYMHQITYAFNKQLFV